MQPEIVPTPSGHLSIRLGVECLEDARDPVAGARAFAGPNEVLGAGSVILVGAGLGYRLRRLRELGVREPVVFEPSPAVLALAREHSGKDLDAAAVFTETGALVSYLVDRVRPSDRMVLLVPPAYDRAFPRARSAVAGALEEVLQLATLRDNTLRERSRGIVESALANLQHLPSLSLATALGRPLAGRPAFIVSAGPSLDGNAHLLPRAAERGAIFAVNTSAPVVAATGATIDVLVAVETVDVSDALARGAPAARAVALELSAAPALYEVPVARRICFLSGVPAFAGLCELLGAEPLCFGGSVATAAFALATLWGADPVVLVGQDLAYTGGRVYATGTPYDGMTARACGHEMVIEGRPEKDAIYARSGLPAQPRVRPRVVVPRWGGGGTVDTTHDLVLFGRWFEGEARRIAGGRRLVNATEGGAAIPGFEEQDLASVLASLPARTDDLAVRLAAAEPVGQARVGAARHRLASDARALARAAAACLRASGERDRRRAQDAVRAAARRTPLSEMHAAPELGAILADRALAPPARARATFEAIRASAERVADLALR